MNQPRGSRFILNKFILNKPYFENTMCIRFAAGHPGEVLGKEAGKVAVSCSGVEDRAAMLGDDPQPIPRARHLGFRRPVGRDIH
jgi:hypothetical protein